MLAAQDTSTRAKRLATLEFANTAEPLPITAEVARCWAELRVKLAEQRRRAKINDLWIAAVAHANGMAVVTQDDDFDPIEAVGGRWLSGCSSSTDAKVSRHYFGEVFWARRQMRSRDMGVSHGRGRWRGGWRWPARGYRVEGDSLIDLAPYGPRSSEVSAK